MRGWRQPGQRPRPAGFLLSCLSGALSSTPRISHRTVQGSPLNLLFPQLAYCNNWWEWQPEWGPWTTAGERGYCRAAGSARKIPERRRRYPVQCAGSSGLSKQSQQDKGGGSLRGCPNGFYFSKGDQAEK